MVKEKTLNLLKEKVADIGGEHTITFIASTANEDRDYEHVDIATFRLPLKGGGHIVVSDLPTEGSDLVDIPLLTDHNLYEVSSTIGSVRRAYFRDGALVFVAGISSRPYAQEMFTLVQEGHLDNAFSIQYRDYYHDDMTNTDIGGEIVEVSLVTRGSNMDAQVLATKSLKGKEMETTEQPAEVVAPAEEAVVEETPAVAEETTETTTETEATTETSTEESAEETTEEKSEEKAEEVAEETTTNEEKETMDNAVAKSLVKEEATQAKSVATTDYLSSKSALTDFKNIVLANHRGSNEQIMKSWNAHLSAKAISGDILPTAIEKIFFKTWIDNPGILGTFRTVARRAVDVYAATATANGTAKGHAKGAQKVNQEIELVRRDVRALAIYKKLPIDLQDLFDDETGELLAFRVEELAGRVAHAIAVGAIVGDGTEYLKSGRGLYPMAADITATSGFGTNVATKIAAVTGDTVLDKAIRTLGAVKAENGEGKVLIVPEGFRTEVALMKNAQGFYMVADPEELLGAKIFELAELADSDYDMIAYAENSYVIAGEANATTRTDFDLNTNQDIMLVERYVGGSARGYKTVAGYAKAA